MLALIPPHCNCLHDLRQLAQQAQGGGAQTYLVGIRGADVSQLTAQAALGHAHAVEDSGNMLPPLYRNKLTLTAVLVRKDDSVAGLISDEDGFQIHGEGARDGVRSCRGISVPGRAGGDRPGHNHSCHAAPATPAG